MPYFAPPAGTLGAATAVPFWEVSLDGSDSTDHLALQFEAPGRFDIRRVAIAVDSGAVRVCAVYHDDGEAKTVVLFIQIGETRFVVLLDPSEPSTRKLCASWVAAGEVSIVFASGNASDLVAIPYRPQLSDFLESLAPEPTEALARSFLKQAHELALFPNLLEHATTDVTPIGSIENVHTYAMLTTRHLSQVAGAYILHPSTHGTSLQ